MQKPSNYQKIKASPNPVEVTLIYWGREGGGGSEFDELRSLPELLDLPSSSSAGPQRADFLDT